MDHGFDGGFEFEDGALLQDGFDVGGERGPVKEVIITGNRQARVVERKRGVSDLGVGDEFRTPPDLLVEKAGMLAME